ncbi:RNA polymerase sigma-70 factor [Chondrinema litorale]|uniref:RNA polymerase sigma-70 factor n=1 Tax=Chondrinema litorale TaxID=2994555 RepID=UPI002542725B|nr:RNA polymerase sigma-70 factor [Chondrinema litorale]UZR98425.1 RNA polymerase sigma-70 factor [Chondrinema litorale]
MQFYSDNSDEQLINKTRVGDKQAFETLFDRYYEVLCDFSFQFLKSKDLSEEAVSDVFIKVWVNRRELKIQSTLKAYLFRAVRNQSINYIEKETKHFEDLSNVSQKPTDNLQAADHLLILEEFQKNIDAIIDQMPDQRKLIFRMNRLEGMKYKEIADALGLSVYTVQNHMVEATKHLSGRYKQLKSLKMWAIVFLLFFFV